MSSGVNETSSKPSRQSANVSANQPTSSIATMSRSGNNEAELKGYFEKLTASSIVTMPLEKAPWGDPFGMGTDPFNINWMVNISAQKA